MTGERHSAAIDYGHRAPRAATADMFRVIGQAEGSNGIYDVEDRANAVGHRSVGVPGVTAGMCRAHELFGALPLERLLEPAIHYAREGFEADPHHLPDDCQEHTQADPVRRGRARISAGRLSPAAGCKGRPARLGRHSRTDRERGQGRPPPGRYCDRHRRGDEATRGNPQRAGPRRLRGGGARSRQNHLQRP